jgi:ankyrin repeat protein
LFIFMQDVARLLLEYGADPNKRYFFGAEINLAHDIESLELLLTFGAHTETRDRSGMTPLMRVARTSNGMEAVLRLLHHNAQVNAMTDARNDYRTVLHYAVLSGNIVLVNLLLKQGAKVDIPAPHPEPDRPSPLDLAILRGDPALVRILLENGANVNRCSPVIGSPLHVACADNIPHRMEIMKVRFFFIHSAEQVLQCFFNYDFRCFFHTAPIRTSKSSATEPTPPFVRH